MHAVVLPAYVSFAAPAMWAGAALLTLPVMAHLLNRYARARRLFPSLMLLRQAAAQQSRVMRLRRWILLLLRCLFVMAVVAAFAQPVWHHDRSQALAAAQGNSVVLLVDVSASMQVLRGGVPLMDVAKSAGDRILDDLRRGVDVANVVYMAAEPGAVFEQLSPNLPALQEQLRRLTATEQRANIAAGLRLAAELLGGFAGPRRLIVLSDLQANNWRPLVESQVVDILPLDVEVVVIDLQVPETPNISISSPRNDPQMPLAGQSVALTAEVHNRTDQTRQVRVTARDDQQSLSAVEVSLEAGQRRDVSFETTWDDAGVHEIVFEVSHDDFVLDDQCFWTVRTHAGIPVAVISDDDSTRPGSESFYLSLALAPHKDADDRFVVQSLTSRELLETDLSSYSTVFVGYLSTLERPVAERLLKYVQQGGACVVFCGQGPVRRNLLLLDELLPTGCLPWVPGPRDDRYRRGDPTRLAGGRWRSRLFKDFDLSSQVALSSIQFGSVWSIEQVRAEAEVLLSFEDSLPALATRQVGQGQLMLANFSPDAESSDLGKHGVFVALIQMLAQNLQRPGVKADHYYVGEAITYRLLDELPATALQVFDPQDEPVRATVQAEGARVLVHITQTQEAGIYRIKNATGDGDAVAVNLDPAEGDLRYVDSQHVRDALARSDSESHVVTAVDGPKPIDLAGRPLWGWAVLLSMTLIGIELTLLGWWRR